MQFTTRQYNQLERAVIDGLRIAVYRRGSEYVVKPERLSMREGREALETIQPATGDRMTLYLDELDSFEIVDG